MDDPSQYGLVPLAQVEGLARFARSIPCRRHHGVVAAFTMVDPGDHGWLTEHRWSLTSHGYPRCKLTDSEGKHRWVHMHRMLMGLKPGDPVDVDHINGDKLDNRRCNLRVVTRQQNLQNRRKITGRSKYRGVCWDPERQMFRAQATVNYKNYFLGRFVTEEAAAEAARRFREANMPFATN